VKDGSSAGDLFLGFVDFNTGMIVFERSVPVPASENDITKMMAGEDAVYLLAVPREGGNTAGELIRVPGGAGEISIIAGILDFFVQGADCYVLVKSDSGTRLIRNELTVPLSLKADGPYRIREVLDGRLVLVSAGDETEVIDIRTGKSLYQYATDYKFLAPDGYDLVIQAVDIGEPEQNDREMIFYKVMIDGVETGRTDSGPASLVREMKVMLEPNRYHNVRLERWVLNSGKGRYDRENNIRQPKMRQIYIPLNRIVKLVITFNNKEYLFNTVPVYK
jgi:hypothetical protein